MPARAPGQLLAEAFSQAVRFCIQKGVHKMALFPLPHLGQVYRDVTIDPFELADYTWQRMVDSRLRVSAIVLPICRRPAQRYLLSSIGACQQDARAF